MSDKVLYIDSMIEYDNYGDRCLAIAGAANIPHICSAKSYLSSAAGASSPVAFMRTGTESFEK